MKKLDEQMNVLFADALNEVEEHLVLDTDGLWVDDSISIEECELMRRAALAYVDENIENIIYHSYFAESGFDNRFEPGIARILQSLGFVEISTCKTEFILLKKVLSIIMNIIEERDKYDEDLNSLTYDDLIESYKTSLDISQIRLDRRINGRQYEKNQNYKIIEINSFAHACEFIDCFQNLDNAWECCLSEDSFEKFKGTYGSIYFVMNKSYRDYQPSVDDKDIEWSDDIDYSYLEMDYVDDRLVDYDRYGLSMIMVVVDSDGRLVRCTGRYGNSFDYENWLLYMDEEELSLVLGVNFYEVFV